VGRVTSIKTLNYSQSQQRFKIYVCGLSIYKHQKDLTKRLKQCNLEGFFKLKVKMPPKKILKSGPGQLKLNLLKFVKRFYSTLFFTLDFGA